MGWIEGSGCVNVSRTARREYDAWGGWEEQRAQLVRFIVGGVEDITRRIDITIASLGYNYTGRSGGRNLHQD